jgi:lysyl-tRNA synthetase class 2
MAADLPPLRARLAARARLHAAIRGFFAERGVLEVVTPVLSPTGTTDLHIDSWRAQPLTATGEASQWLRTSPEFFHKRLLADGSGPIYELGPVFRTEESGPRHRPEFTMLEWYRPGWDDAQLRTEVADLVATCFRAFERAPPPVQTLSFDAAFRRYAGVPAEATPAEYAAACVRAGVPVPEGALDRDAWQDWLRGTVIEAALPEHTATFLTDFPASQAALARLRGDPPVAARFELYLGRHELANGYHELTDAAEQRRRFDADRARRHAQGRDCPPIDEALIAALERGLPDCAGVALGVDRLLMALTGARDIAEVLAFPAG